MMKHKRHQKDRRDKNEKVHRHEDHRYYKAEYSAKTDYKQYTMKDLSKNCGDGTEPKKLIIYIVNIVKKNCFRICYGFSKNERLIL
jgi:hypothetical protein